MDPNEITFPKEESFDEDFEPLSKHETISTIPISTGQCIEPNRIIDQNVEIKSIILVEIEKKDNCAIVPCSKEQSQSINDSMSMKEGEWECKQKSTDSISSTNHNLNKKQSPIEVIVKPNGIEPNSLTQSSLNCNNALLSTVPDSTRILPTHAMSPIRSTSNSSDKIDEINKGYTPLDILCGRGGVTNHHEGNKRFRHLVSNYRAEYLHSKKKHKCEIAKNIVNIVHQYGGRFLRKTFKNDGAAIWSETEYKRALEKTSQALREGLDVRRKVMSSSSSKTISQNQIQTKRMRPSDGCKDGGITRVYNLN